MKFREIYEEAVKKGMKEDLRPKEVIESELKKAKSAYRKLKGAEKAAFDKASMKNPYADSRMLYGTGNEEIKTVMVGIDIDVQEILLADRLRERGVKVDLVISHHPSGRALAQLDKVMIIQPGLWESLGLSKDVAHGIMEERRKEVERGVAPTNHNRAVDAAKILNIPFMCLHTVADNCVTNYLQKMFNGEKPKKLKQVLSLLRRIPEYRLAMRTSAGPHILVGEENNEAGKIFVDMTGGTSGPDRILPRLSQSGVKTIVGMHAKEAAFKRAKTEYLNYVIAGHIASDTLGLNLLFDAIDKKGKLKFIECSGYKRFKR